MNNRGWRYENLCWTVNLRFTIDILHSTEIDYRLENEKEIRSHSLTISRNFFLFSPNVKPLSDSYEHGNTSNENLKQYRSVFRFFFPIILFTYMILYSRNLILYVSRISHYFQKICFSLNSVLLSLLLRAREARLTYKIVGLFLITFYTYN